eukprot:5885726-Alexandrium_andersonii.AAC.1
MSASLVGSEMCIRDRAGTAHVAAQGPRPAERHQCRRRARAALPCVRWAERGVPEGRRWPRHPGGREAPG